MPEEFDNPIVIEEDVNTTTFKGKAMFYGYPKLGSIIWDSLPSTDIPEVEEEKDKAITFTAKGYDKLPAKQHQTVVFVRPTSENGPRERAERLIQSLNRKTTMKADIRTVAGRKFFVGAHFNAEDEDKDFTDQELQEIAREHEYVQAIIVSACV